ncbi:GyrI-like domain-containing protein [Nocardioides aestuarii]|uniref:GyrI-like domain-containing protein n=1 Tax=Nocardioides aestuarii TaxID=252231 RepID=A0ABW4TKF2_9ACTN
MKADLKKELASYRARKGVVEEVDLPPRRYLMVDGSGDPNTAPAYAAALAAIYPVAYRLKFAAKAAGRDYVVPPLEALWWADDMDAFTRRRDKDAWRWTVMLLVPDWVDDATVAAELVDPVRLETLTEGRCVQTLHVGPYDAEGPTIEALHAGRTLTGRHHEVYLNDALRTAPERLRTILRQPVSD